jgi:hypothetical protein
MMICYFRSCSEGQGLTASHLDNEGNGVLREAAHVLETELERDVHAARCNWSAWTSWAKTEHLTRPACARSPAYSS